MPPRATHIAFVFFFLSLLPFIGKVLFQVPLVSTSYWWTIKTWVAGCAAKAKNFYPWVLNGLDHGSSLVVRNDASEQSGRGFFSCLLLQRPTCYRILCCLSYYVGLNSTFLNIFICKSLTELIYNLFLIGTWRGRGPSPDRHFRIAVRPITGRRSGFRDLPKIRDQHQDSTNLEAAGNLWIHPGVSSSFGQRLNNEKNQYSSDVAF